MAGEDPPHPSARSVGQEPPFATAKFLAGDPTRLIALVVLAFALLRASPADEGATSIDYYQYWVVARALQDDRAEDIYAPAERRRLAREGFAAARAEASILGVETRRLRAATFRREELGTYATPWLYAAIRPTVGDDYERDQRRFQRAGLVALLLALALLGRMLRLPLAAWALLAVLLASWFEPALSDDRVGNVNRFQLALLALALALRGASRRPLGDLAGGLVLALGVFFKPTTAAVALVLGLGWCLTGQARRLIPATLGAVTGAALAVTLGAVAFGSLSIWGSWLRELQPLLAEYDHSLVRGNMSLVRVVRETLGAADSRLFAAIFLGAPLAVLWRRRSVLSARPLSERGALDLDVLLVGLGGVLPLLAADLAWLHYFVLAVPLALFLLRPVPVGNAGLARALVRALACTAFVVLGLGPGLANRLGLVGVGLLTAGAALTLFAAGLYELDRLAAPPEGSAAGPAEPVPDGFSAPGP